MLKIIKITNWNELQEISKEMILWGFRGQSDSDWDLITTFHRLAKSNKLFKNSYWHKEYFVLRHFMRRAKYYSEHLPLESELFEWLSFMQHHGSPTRLLDFSHSVFIASFFAVETALSDSAVWAINLEYLRRKNMEKYKIDNHRTNIDQFNLKILKVADSLISINGEKPKDISLGVLNIEPEQLHERILHQQGLFLFPTDIDSSFSENLGIKNINYKEDNSTIEDINTNTDYIIKFIIPHEIKHDIIKILYSMNINSRTLFPGLDGFARSIQTLITPP